MMKVIDGRTYYNIEDVAKVVSRTSQTIRLWDRWSNEREAEGETRLIPKPKLLGQRSAKHWTEDQVDRIKAFASTINYGSIAVHSRTRWGKRGY